MDRFKTLLLREWLQHRRGWMVVVALPPLLMLLLLLLERVSIHIDGHEAATDLAALPAPVLVMISVVAGGALCFVLAWGAALLQSPGLARRDQQDRSIEFWLSLPVGHGAALSAPLLAHLLLFPLAALVLGTLAGLLISPLAVARFAQAADWLSVPWGALLLATAALVARMALGFLLATLWLSPLVLLVMAASAWLKRWGLPAVVATALLLGGVSDRLLGQPLVSDLGRALLQNAGRSFVAGAPGLGIRLVPGADPAVEFLAYPSAAWHDAMLALGRLADPLLLLALALSAGCFGLLVLRRRRA